MTERALDVLDAYRQEARLSHGELWLRYFELGGMSTRALNSKPSSMGWWNRLPTTMT